MWKLNITYNSALINAMKYFIDAFKSFDQVVASCFGKKLLPDYMETIDDFKVKYNKLKIIVNPSTIVCGIRRTRSPPNH